jgi:hypothetical protein
MPPPVTLVPFTAEQLALVQPWFRHPEVVRRLGGPEWVERELRLLDSGIGEMFRGRRVLRTHSWVAFDAAGDAVAHIGGEVYDRWSRYAAAAGLAPETWVPDWEDMIYHVRRRPAP